VPSLCRNVSRLFRLTSNSNRETLPSSNHSSRMYANSHSRRILQGIQSRRDSLTHASRSQDAQLDEHSQVAIQARHKNVPLISTRLLKPKKTKSCKIRHRVSCTANHNPANFSSRASRVTPNQSPCLTKIPSATRSSHFSIKNS